MAAVAASGDCDELVDGVWLWPKGVNLRPDAPVMPPFPTLQTALLHIQACASQAGVGVRVGVGGVGGAAVGAARKGPRSGVGAGAAAGAGAGGAGGASAAESAGAAARGVGPMQEGQVVDKKEEEEEKQEEEQASRHERVFYVLQDESIKKSLSVGVGDDALVLQCPYVCAWRRRQQEMDLDVS
jgi:hypothetical protein